MILKKLVIALGLVAFVLPSAQANFPNGISSGDTSENATVLWARSSREGSVRFQVKDASNNIVHDETVLVTDPLVPAKLVVGNLQSGQNYTYTVTDFNAVSTGTFKTAASDGLGGLVFGVTGDWRGELAPYPAIKNINGQNFDFFVKLGDTIYADYPSPDVPLEQAKTLVDYRLKHNEVYSRRNNINTLARMQKNVSIFSMIDDHEVINDFAGGALASTDARFGETSGLINQTALYNNGLQAFTEYNAINDKRYGNVGDPLTDGRPDLYRAQRYGKTAGFYMLDARSFRDKELTDVSDITNAAQIGAFIANSFDIGKATTRTMLGQAQISRLKADLMSAQADGVVWKFIAVPEPIQNLGVFGAADRFEGYASERTELLQFINENNIKNVVFIAADIHGTLINDLTYQRREDVLTALTTVGNPLAAPQIKTSAFEISTGSVAFAPSFGDTITNLLGIIPNGNLFLAQMFAAVGVSNLEQFNQLPMAVRNAAMEGLVNNQLTQLGYTPVGLQDNSRIKAKVVKGGNTALFSFGWTSFVVNPRSRVLRITTYGIKPYSSADLASNPTEVAERQPEVLSQILVTPEK
jgi:phosphodiesterase/alkaline phosphatase D-like protein